MESETIKSEIETLNTQLKTITNQRNELISSIRAKYREMVKNADDALKYVGEYIKLSVKFQSWQIEGEDAYCMDLYSCNLDIDEIMKLFNELCNPYLRIIEHSRDYNSITIIFKMI